MRLFRIPEAAMAEYLGDRPRDHRVKYKTFVGGGKTYPYRSLKRGAEVETGPVTEAEYEAVA